MCQLRIIEVSFFKQVKWYKGTHEFYRYSPREEAKLFLVENLDVDVSVYQILAHIYASKITIIICTNLNQYSLLFTLAT